MYIGIDLGTTYSVAAYMDDRGETNVIQNIQGDNTTPSVVLFDTDDEVIVGEEAKKLSIIRAKDVVLDVKNYMGKNKILMRRGNKEYTPEQISSFIIRKIVNDSAKALGEEITGVVVTVPAYFSDARRKATEDAVAIAGVRLIGMINEPTAAALVYIKEHDIKNQNIMIYDLGGGTFDVTLLHVVDYTQIDVISTNGLSNAGGRFFDMKIVDFVADYFENKYGIDLTDDEYKDDYQELLIKAEDAKIRLSSMKTVDIIMKIGNIKDRVIITREQFEQMIYPIYMRTEVSVDEALESADLQTEDIDKVLLVGGSSRVPLVYDRLKDYMNKEILRDIHPDEAVALGAAIFCDLCKNNYSNFTDVCSHGIGVVVINNNIEENEIVIPKNSKIPITKIQNFRTMVDGQEVIELTITEGEYNDIRDVSILGKVEVNLPKDIKKGDLVTISINLDENQMVNVKLKLPDYDFEEDYHLKRIANLDDETVKKYKGILRDYTVK